MIMIHTQLHCVQYLLLQKIRFDDLSAGGRSRSDDNYIILIENGCMHVYCVNHYYEKKKRCGWAAMNIINIMITINNQYHSYRYGTWRIDEFVQNIVFFLQWNLLKISWYYVKLRKHSKARTWWDKNQCFECATLQAMRLWFHSKKPNQRYRNNNASHKQFLVDNVAYSVGPYHDVVFVSQFRTHTHTHARA